MFLGFVFGNWRKSQRHVDFTAGFLPCGVCVVQRLCGIPGLKNPLVLKRNIVLCLDSDVDKLNHVPKVCNWTLLRTLAPDSFFPKLVD